MIRDEALKIAAKCGNDNGTTEMEDLDFLVRFAEAIAAAEREACVKLCDGWLRADGGEDVPASWCAAAIRARGGKCT